MKLVDHFRKERHVLRRLNNLIDKLVSTANPGPAPSNAPFEVRSVLRAVEWLKRIHSNVECSCSAPLLRLRCQGRNSAVRRIHDQRGSARRFDLIAPEGV